MRTSPLPEKNVFAEFEPDVSCETTFLKSFVTNCTALWSLIPDFRAAAYAASTFHFAEPELNGLGVTTWMPDFVRSAMGGWAWGFPCRRRKPRTNRAPMSRKAAEPHSSEPSPHSATAPRPSRAEGKPS